MRETATRTPLPQTVSDYTNAMARASNISHYRRRTILPKSMSRSVSNSRICEGLHSCHKQQLPSAACEGEWRQGLGHNSHHSPVRFCLKGLDDVTEVTVRLVPWIYCTLWRTEAVTPNWAFWGNLGSVGANTHGVCAPSSQRPGSRGRMDRAGQSRDKTTAKDNDTRAMQHVTVLCCRPAFRPIETPHVGTDCHKPS